MSRLKRIIFKYQSSTLSDILIITFFTILAHGLMISWLGFYTDDWTFLWTYHRYGSEGLTQYFSTNRPLWGLLYQITMPLLGIKPLTWHIFALFWGLAASLATYWLVITVWPYHKRIGLLAGLFFSVYPGFVLQPIAITFGHILIIYTIFIVSLVLTSMALTTKRFEVSLTIGSLLLSAINLLTMEYFYTLEGIRLVLIIYIITRSRRFSEILERIIRKYLPYFTLLLLVSVWRAFFFDVQTYNYDLSLASALKTDLFGAFYGLLITLFVSIYNSAILAWIQPFIVIIEGWRVTNFYLLMFGLIILSMVLTGLVLFIKSDTPGSFIKLIKANKALILFGFFGLILAGWPFYLTDLPVVPGGFNSRFTLPFILGGSIFLAAVVETIPSKWVKITLASVLIGSSVGYHMLSQNDFRFATLEDNRMISQLITRIPSLQPGTTIMSDEGSEFFTMTTLSARLNLIYDPPPVDRVNFGWIFPRDLARRTSNPIPMDEDFEFNLVTFPFFGNTSSVIVIQRPHGSCLYVLDQETNVTVPQLNDFDGKKLSNKSLILPEDRINTKFSDLFGADGPNDWCTIYQEAELAIQFNEYSRVAELYSIANEMSLTSFHSSELYAFIKAFGYLGDWEKAKGVTEKALEMNDLFDPNLCNIWEEFTKDQDLTIDSLNLINQQLVYMGCIFQPEK